MIPKEKAEELIETYLNMNDGLIQEFIPIPIEGARQCALIAVDEVLKECSWELTGFWISVKQEIENL
jgi:glutathione synthase/RimK-type ligase-like ATP-grasp enzyme